MPTILAASTSGMLSAQRTIDNVGNNISNFQTTTYKRIRSMAEGLPDAANISAGGRLGVAVTQTDLIMTDGTAVSTGDLLNFAIVDDAFYRVTSANGEPVYTRNGSLRTDSSGQITFLGMQLDPPMAGPVGARSVEIGSDGKISARDVDGNEIDVGQVELYRFSNPKGLRDIGGGLYTESANSGAIVVGRPGNGAFSPLIPGHLEGSNVEIADEMTQMMIAQRVYTSSAKSFSIGDDMLRIATQLTR